MNFDVGKEITSIEILRFNKDSIEFWIEKIIYYLVIRTLTIQNCFNPELCEKVYF